MRIACIVLVLLAAARPADACSCKRPVLCELLANGSVFIGTARESTEIGQFATTTFDVTRVLAGELGATVDVLALAGHCGMPFEAGSEYLVYADPDEKGRLQTTWCTAHLLATAQRNKDPMLVPTKRTMATVRGVVTLGKVRTRPGIALRVAGRTIKTGRNGTFTIALAPGRHPVEVLQRGMRAREGKPLELVVTHPLACPRPRLALEITPK